MSDDVRINFALPSPAGEETTLSAREHTVLKEGAVLKNDGSAHKEHEETNQPNPMHHIKDKVLFGWSKDGRVVWRPLDEHGTAKTGYEAAMLGPVRLEFTKHMFDVTLAAALLAAAGIWTARRVLKDLSAERAPRGPLANAVEAVLQYIRDEVVISAGGRPAAPYTPLFLTYFLFILICNLLGVIPEVGSGTGNIGVTAALGGSVYLLILFLGMKEQGILKYFAHLVPPGTPWWMWPLMFALEIISPLIKCFVLCVRLFANMISGHLVVGNTLILGTFGAKALLPPVLGVVALGVGVPLVLGISLLEILVCFIQAYVFTMLAVVFISAAVHPEH